MRVSELCGVRIGDVDREQRAVRIQRTGGEQDWIPLSPNGWFQVLSYLEQYRLKEERAENEGGKEDHLFLSEWYQPLTSNSTTLLFNRLAKRAGISEKPVTPSVLRDTFAVRFLQAGGEPEVLRAILGLRGRVALTRYEHFIAQKSKNKPQKKSGEVHPPGQQLVPHPSKQHRKKSSSAETRNHQRRGTRKHNDIVEKGAADAKKRLRDAPLPYLLQRAWKWFCGDLPDTAATRMSPALAHKTS